MEFPADTSIAAPRRGWAHPNPGDPSEQGPSRLKKPLTQQEVSAKCEQDGRPGLLMAARQSSLVVISFLSGWGE